MNILNLLWFIISLFLYPNCRYVPIQDWDPEVQRSTHYHLGWWGVGENGDEGVTFTDQFREKVTNLHSNLLDFPDHTMDDAPSTRVVKTLRVSFQQW